MKLFWKFLTIITILIIAPIIAENIIIAGNKWEALEIFMKLQNASGNIVEFEAKADFYPIWNPLNYLIDTPNWETLVLKINADDYDPQKTGWHTDGGTQYGMPSLGWCKQYTIEVIKPQDKSASFKVDTYGWQQVKDIHVMYDLANDKFTDWDGNDLADVENLRDNTEYLQPTQPKNFHCTNSSSYGSHPHFTWEKPNHPTGVTFKYNIYQSVDGGPYYRVASNLTTTSWTDNDVVLNHGGNHFSYYATAFGSQSPESDPSNTALIRGNPSKPMPNDPEDSEKEQGKQEIAFSVYPNPFNPETQISYSLQCESLINLSIYNIAGQKVTTLVEERQSVGIHNVVFNGKNLPAGIYLVNLQVGRENYLGKVLLVK